MTAIAAALLGAATCARADEPTLENVPHVVVKTVPQAGASGVAAGPAEISATFSKPMRAGSWSWVKVSEASFPPLRGQPSYSVDQRTCTL
ncbi:MAG TPA: Ig-like domain-containing protein, partial [Roseiarcus sp.]|nr:Ig-like domain-containing protein [Roseiarcus sp.]